MRVPPGLKIASSIYARDEYVYHVETSELTDVDIGAHKPETGRYATVPSVNACVALLEYVCSSSSGPTPS